MCMKLLDTDKLDWTAIRCGGRVDRYVIAKLIPINVIRTLTTLMLRQCHVMGHDWHSAITQPGLLNRSANRALPHESACLQLYQHTNTIVPVLIPSPPRQPLIM